MVGSKPIKLGSRSTAIEALRGVDLTGKVAVVTGGNSGLGSETIRALATAGADCVLCCRNKKAGQAVAAELQPTVKGKISVQRLDLADLSSIKAAGDALASLPSLDLLVLNAGVMAVRPKQHTKDGFELQFGTNHLGHFYLSSQLLPKMKKQGTPGRVVVLSSSAHGFGRIHIDDLNCERRWYGAWASYGNAKLANLLFVKELARRLQEEGSPVEAFALHPGICHTSIGEHMGGRATVFYCMYKPWLKSAAQGAATTIYAATAPELSGKSGAYLEDCHEAKPWRCARDADMARRLWDKSEELVQAALKKAGLA
ncbi:short-chain dehydrogenase reductase SDR [Chlorella sorokiniana]|uniref:Short-chain dehydrogenase reductase SDR n=1 Tax=Chlorella sorokiniana TaxID=3076 RepID=A0A2P6TRY2_CHLSO|nr:short-chain dehydrogenase reductase SDR [Chlorella sorokiniana]|eukprot:PRW56818.1 short-chain dehydrogenase reductase SDR [Chlorella sorokiniana]